MKRRIQILWILLLLIQIPLFYPQSLLAQHHPTSLNTLIPKDSLHCFLNKVPVRISSINYKGLVHLRESYLNRSFNSGVIESEEALRVSLKNITSLAVNEGYLGFLIERIDVAYTPDSAKAEINITVIEGPQYVIQKIDLRDSLSFQESNPLPREIYLIIEETENTPFQSDALEDAATRMVEIMESAGYPFSRVKITGVESLEIDPENPDILPVKLIVTINRGALVTVGDIVLTGLQTSKPEIVLRELPFRIGHLFLEKNLEAAKSKLLRLGLFEKVTTEKPLFLPSENQPKKGQPRDSLRAVLRLTLEEGNPNTFDGILGYQPALGPSDEGFFTGQINFSLRNLFGTGRRLDVRWTKPNAPTQDVRLFYQEPWVLNLPLTLSLELLQLKQDSSFSQLNYGVTGIFRFNNAFWITANFSRELVTPIIESLTPSQTIFQSSITLSGLGVLYDTRDYPLNPQSGWLFRNEYRIGTKSIVGSDSLLSLFGLQKSVLQQRLSLDFEFYQRLFFRQVVFFRLKGTAILSDEIQFSDLMRIGGALSLRGYREQQFLASQFLFGGAEYRFILSQKTFLFGFFDAGYFSRPANPVVPSDIAESNFRIGYGFGFRFETPLGLTGFTFALGEGDSFLQGKIHFNIINEF